MKKVCIIDGSIAVNINYKKILKDFDKSFDLTYYKLGDLNIHSCIGCWECWLKTPGVCLIKDDQEEILKHYINAHEVVFISNIKTGFITSTLKFTMDRLIPVVLPYIRSYKGEMHHFQRYEHSPNLHILINDDDINKSVETLIHDYFERVALNMGSSVKSFIKRNDARGIIDVLSNC